MVAGVGQTRFLTRGEVSEYELTARVMKEALADAGLTAADVDGVVRFDREAVWELELVAGLGARALGFYNALPFAAGSAPALLRMAAMGVEEGLASVVLAYHARNPFAKTAYGPGMVGNVRDGVDLIGAAQYQVPTGVSSAIHAAAVVIRRHMERYGTTPRALAAVVSAARRHAARNPRALRRKTLTTIAYRRSPFVAEPLRLADCAPAAAGAACLVITHAERARDLRRKPIRVLGSMQAIVPRAADTLGEWFKSERDRPTARAAREMFGRARLAPRDVDLAFLHDATSGEVLLALEEYGFTRRGQAGDFVTGGGIAGPRAELPVNLNGGQLGEGYLDGVNNLVGAVHQLRGEAPLQRKGAEVALVAGSLLEPTSAVLLGV